MSIISRFIQGESFSILKRYDSSDVLQETVNFPQVADTDNSFVKQWFEPYPADELRQHELLGGDLKEDAVTGHIFNATIYYKTIATETFKDILNCIISAQSSGYLTLQPREDSAKSYKVIYTGDINLESKTRWLHNTELNFKGKELVTNLTLSIPTTGEEQ